MRGHLAETLVWSQITCVRQGPQSPHGKGRFGGRNPQFAAMPLIAKLLWPLFSLTLLPSPPLSERGYCAARRHAVTLCVSAKRRRYCTPLRVLLHSIFGDRAFAAAGAGLWNSLPPQVYGRLGDKTFGRHIFRWPLGRHGLDV